MAAFNKKEYDLNYQKNKIVQKMIKFNKKKDIDKLDFIKDKNFNRYVHGLIEKDMKETKEK